MPEQGSSCVDEAMMRRALALARTHLGATGSNPSVGCVIVSPDGRTVLGEAVTARDGRPHAEPQALSLAGPAARGATAYVTLEPCSHFGKTPPCADALIDAGIARVVVGLQDPDERVAGRGLARLEAAGIAVTRGVLEEEGRHLLAGYLLRKTAGRPLVTVKLAVSADGMIGRRGGGQVAITGPEARADVHRLRAESDAILVGIGTALEDDPMLDVRLPGLEDRSPLRLILDRGLALPVDSKLAQTAGRVPTRVVTAPGARALQPERVAALASAGVAVQEAEGLMTLLDDLGAEGLSNLMVEGGAQVIRSFLEADRIDRLRLFTGRVRIGPEGVETPFPESLLAERFALVQEEQVGADTARHFERIR
ncbi:riboflavin biosynthesis protein RibD [Rhizobium rhizosphaerae]|uniref:Riboflavin biosynthesis protein RibD n=1 Tax=Xaviernesmea rhizosphaerae TaxID=1672749 RepID=A0ABX3PJE1_9HYPH|nr:riboflavin biosynthesis protein RibD [Xaviernesmea rhizosphaerae]